MGIPSPQGRNNQGRKTVWGKGGGRRRVYRFVDFKPYELDLEGTIERIEYDPNRSANIALVKYEDGELRYIIAANGNKMGDKIIHSSSMGPVKPASSMELCYIPTGTKIFNIEMKPGKGAQIARSAGAFAILLAKETKYCLVRLRSGEVRKVPSNCRAFIGTVSNPDHQNISLGKAGASFLRGRKPKVRGVAMNPIDHPHGGGEGKTSTGGPSVNRKGNCKKGQNTRNKKKSNRLIVVKRKKKSRK